MWVVVVAVVMVRLLIKTTVFPSQQHHVHGIFIQHLDSTIPAITSAKKLLSPQTPQNTQKQADC
jgi:hypothetical protein